MANANFLDNFYTSLSEDENLETTTLIWLDSSVSKSNEQINIQKKIRSVINHIKIFENPQECEKYIQHSFRDDRIVLITNEKLGKDLIPCIHHFRQITSIYIFCMDKKKNEIWTKDFLKIKGVFINLNELVQNLIFDQQKQTHTKLDEPLSINIFTTRTNPDQSTIALNYKFVYQNFFLDYLLQMKPTSDDKKQFISRCEKLYKNNDYQLTIIHEFNETYTSNQALWWYTRETFLYHLLNKALRIQNIDLLFYFQFFLYDIQKQLQENQCLEFIQIYRAQLMTINEINELKNSIGEYISMNSFFSTTKDKIDAILLFDDMKSNYNDLEKVLFQIDANPNHIGMKSFADISLKSYFNNEYEVLIMLGAIFHLKNIILNEENIWIINLSLCSDQDNDLKSQINKIKKDFNDQEINLFSFGRILHHMNKYDEAEKYYQRLLIEFQNDNKKIALCYYHFGRVYSGREKYDESIQWYEKSLKIMMETMNSDDLNIAECFNSIGNVYRKKKNYEQALKAYQNALDIWKQKLGDDHIKVAMCLINMGIVYDAKENYINALECLEIALIIKQNYHGINHSDIAILYNNIGLVHECLDHFDLALENFEKALDIYRTSSSDLQNIEYGSTLENIGYLYENNEEWRQALIYLEEAATIYRYTLTSTHPRLIQIEQHIEHVSSLIEN